MYYVDKNGRVKQENIFWENAIIYWSILVGCLFPTSVLLLPYADSITAIGVNFQSYWEIFVFEFLLGATMLFVASLLGVFAIYAFTFFYSLVTPILFGGSLAIQKIPNELILHLQQIVDEISDSKQAKFSRLRLRWSPSDLGIGARIIGTTSPMLLISGGFTVLINKNKTIAKQIIAHELGHVANNDRLLFPYLMLVLFASSFVIYSSLLSRELFQAFLYIISPVPTILILFWRREYYADTTAINSLDDRKQYVKLLESDMREASIIRFHPSKNMRISAILRGSPGSYRSILNIFACINLIVFSLQVFGALWESAPSSFFYSPSLIEAISYSPVNLVAILFFLIFLGIPLGALCNEVKKGKVEWKPATSVEIINSH